MGGCTRTRRFGRQIPGHSSRHHPENPGGSPLARARETRPQQKQDSCERRQQGRLQLQRIERFHDRASGPACCMPAQDSATSSSSNGLGLRQATPITSPPSATPIAVASSAMAAVGSANARRTSSGPTEITVSECATSIRATINRRVADAATNTSAPVPVSRSHRIARTRVHADQPRADRGDTDGLTMTGELGDSKPDHGEPPPGTTLAQDDLHLGSEQHSASKGLEWTQQRVEPAHPATWIRPAFAAPAHTCGLLPSPALAQARRCPASTAALTPRAPSRRSGAGSSASTRTRAACR